MRNTLYFRPTAILAACWLSSCGVESGSSAGDTERQAGARPANTIETQSCSVAETNEWVYGAMQDYYLFYNQVERNVDLTQFDSPEALMQAIRVSPNDRYSYVTDETTYEAFFSEGETFGYGWNFARSDGNFLLFSLIEPGSPLDDEGVERGEKLIAINEYDIDSFFELSSDERAQMIGTGDEVKTLRLTVESKSQERRQLSVTKSFFNIKTVLDAQVMEYNNSRVGYLSFYQFIQTSSEELDEAFALFNEADVSELVVDLRFNGGGRISVASELASRIIGDNHTQDVFATFAHNDKYQQNNASFNFESLPDSLDLGRVFVLQSSNTCSASELVVNSLRPFMEVITVGSTSCGKPYATSPNTRCGKVANALEIELLNAAGVGDYFDGIPADCPAGEDVSFALGDPAEPLLATSLSYISGSSCAVVAGRSRSAAQRLTSDLKPLWHGGSTL